MLRDALRSILAQDEASLEIIVVNDGGAVGPLPDDERIKLIESSGEGVAAARNAGLSASSGQFVAFLDLAKLLSDLRPQRR